MSTTRMWAVAASLGLAAIMVGGVSAQKVVPPLHTEMVRWSLSVYKIQVIARIPFSKDMDMRGGEAGAMYALGKVERDMPPAPDFEIVSLPATGVVVDGDSSSGYLVLTNRHVALINEYLEWKDRRVQLRTKGFNPNAEGGEELYLVDGNTVTRLELLMDDPVHDIALLSMPPGTSLNVFPGLIGGVRLSIGDSVVTEGWPVADGKREISINSGEFVGYREHGLGLAHIDLSVSTDRTIERGESGGAIFAVEESGSLRIPVLVGLMHAGTRERGANLRLGPDLSVPSPIHGLLLTSRTVR